jgi:Holliday junction DNA helicase RuvA
MIARLSGIVVDRGPDYLVLDVGGVGYLVYAPAQLVSRAQAGAEITLHTHLVVREDGMTLFGFAHPHEQRLFQVLLAVNGVGPRVALSLLSVLAADELSFAIASGNAAALARAPGVGQRLASRIVVDLRDRMTSAGPAGVPGLESEDVVAALMGLGYSQAEATEAVARSEFPNGASIEEKVRIALGYFARSRIAGD